MKRLIPILALFVAAGVQAASPPNCGSTWNNGLDFGQPSSACAAYAQFIHQYGWNVDSCTVNEYELLSQLRGISDPSSTTSERLPRDNCTAPTSTPPPSGAASGSSSTVMTIDVGSIDVSSAAQWWWWGFTCVMVSYLLGWGVGTVLSMLDVKPAER